MLHNKFCVNWSTGSQEDFEDIWAWRPSWSCDQHHINFSFPFTQKLTYTIWLKMAKWFLRKASFNFHVNDFGPRSRNVLDLEYSVTYIKLN